jgi:hypothetical protein
LEAETGGVVHAVGTSGNWDHYGGQLSKGATGKAFSGSCRISPGMHGYKFQVNGEWILDRRNLCLCQNAFGSLNNVPEVRSSWSPVEV